MPATAAKTGAKSTFTFDAVAIAEARMIKGFPQTVEPVDCTHLESPDDHEEMIPGDTVKTGEIEIECAMGYTQEALMRTKLEAFLVGDATYVVNGRASYAGKCFLTGIEPKEAKRGEAYTHTLKFRATGKWTRTAAV